MVNRICIGPITVARDWLIVYALIIMLTKCRYTSIFFILITDSKCVVQSTIHVHSNAKISLYVTMLPHKSHRFITLCVCLCVFDTRPGTPVHRQRQPNVCANERRRKRKNATEQTMHNGTYTHNVNTTTNCCNVIQSNPIQAHTFYVSFVWF